MQFSHLLTIFLTGFVAGGFACIAVQGGLLATTLAQREEDRLKYAVKSNGILPILSFLISKLIAYTILGFLLGWFGSLFQLSIPTQVALQMLVVIFMIGTALSILDVHPLFRYFIIQPPRFLTRLIRKQSRSKEIFAPAVLGGFTIFIPCGATQAIMALAIASGRPLYAAAMLFAFILGTSPVFFILGFFTTTLGTALQKKFMRFAAFAILLLAIFNLNDAVALTGSTLTLNALGSNVWCVISYCDNARGNEEIINNNASVSITTNGYTPSTLTVKAGARVTIHLNNIDSQNCTQAFTIPSMGIQKIVPTGQSDTIAFNAPSQAEDISFMCSAGLYRGTIHVKS